MKPTMNRQILFRGKRTDNGEWVEGFLIIEASGQHCIHSTLDDGTKIAWEVIPESVGEFIGLHDKNGNKIFEGDVIGEFDVITWCDRRNGWASSVYDFHTKDFILCHCYNCDGDFDLNDLEEIEVIGNIHDKTNPNE
jgi:uncharacterized phage protein (TIGR01671 family)